MNYHHSEKYAWSPYDAFQAYLRALVCDVGLETVLRRHLKNAGIIEKLITAGDKKTTILIAGPSDGQPILLIHGTPGSAISWWKFLKTPGPFQIIAIDRPGFSPVNRIPPDPVRDYDMLAEILISVTENQQAVLAGHSMGGGIAAKLAADFPQRVKGLVLIGASLNPNLEEIKPVQYTARKAPLKFFLNRSARNSNEELIKYPEFLERLQPDLEKIKCPVLAVHAKDDGLVPFANVSFMETEFKGVLKFKKLLFEQGGHDLQRSKCGEIVNEIGRNF